MRTARLLLTTSVSLALLFAAFLLVARVRAEETMAPRTQTTYTSSGEGVEVIPYLVWNREKLYLDFEDLDNVVDFHFNVTYTSDNVKRGVEGKISPASWPIQGHYKGKPYLRHEITIGTCSGKTCRYHRSLSNMKVVVTTTLASGDVKEVTRTVTIPLK